jgi:hypothetical protein
MRRRWVPIAFLVEGLLCMVAGIVVFAVGVATQVFVNDTVEAPAKVPIAAHVGDYYVYQLVGTIETGFGYSVSSSGPPTLQSNEVSVTSPTKRHVATWLGSGSETITDNSAIYADAVGFQVSSPGVYVVTIKAVSPRAMIVAPSVGDAFSNSVPWLLLCLPGLAGVTWGCSLLVVSQRRTRVTVPTTYWPRAVTPSAMAGAPPPGWYQDPSGDASWRWWDGRAWTRHTA